MQPRRWLLFGLIGIIPLGCQHLQGDPPVLAHSTPLGEVVLEEVTDPHWQFEWEGLPERMPESANLPVPQMCYRALTEQDCQCLAVQEAAIANLLDAENDAQPSQQRQPHPRFEDLPRQRVIRVLQETRQLAAMEARNQAAATALARYFDLAQAEATLELLLASRKILDEAVTEAAKGRELQLELYQQLRRDRLDLEKRYINTLLAIEQLNAELQQHLGVDLPKDERFWPVHDWSVPPVAEDIPGLTKFALAHRPELRLLRTLLTELDPETLPVIRQYLQGISGLLGSAVPAQARRPIIVAIPLLNHRGKFEAAARRQQLREYLQERERTIAAEVRLSAASLQAQAQLVALAREQSRQRESQLEQARQQLASGLVSTLELSRQVLAWQESRGAVMQAVVGWNKSRIQLKLAQGVFVTECLGDLPGCETIHMVTAETVR